MTRGFLDLGLMVALVWAVACSSDDKKKTTADGGCTDSGCPTPSNKICTEDDECSEQSSSCTECPEAFSRCERISTTTTGTCTKPCTSDGDCPSNHSCQEGPSIGLEPSCIATCSGGTACPAGHTCLGNSMGLSICIPSAWNTF